MRNTRRGLLRGLGGLSVGALAGCTALEDAVGANDGVLAAVEAEDGTERWTFETDDWIRSSPAVADGTVFVGSD